MPNMDGLTMLEKIRYEQGNSTVEVVMLTAEDSRELESRASSLGVAGWVVKPVTAKFAEVIATVCLSSSFDSGKRGEAGVTDGARTRDHRLHKPMLYQLSYDHHKRRPV